MADTDGYNGWENWETWNVALWLQNDEMLYSIMRQTGRDGYNAVAMAIKDLGAIETPDGAGYFDCRLNLEELESMVAEEFA